VAEVVLRRAIELVLREGLERAKAGIYGVARAAVPIRDGGCRRRELSDCLHGRRENR
jgi:hypothetical protein